MPYRPTIGIPFHPAYTNAAFFQSIGRLQECQFNTLLLDCRYYDDEHLASLIKENMTIMDGLLLPGNPYDIDPKFYNEKIISHDLKIAPDDRLFNYQKAIFIAAEKLGMPILGICAGSNVINIVLGRKLEQYLPVNGNVNHDIDPRKGQLAHEVMIKKGTHLHDILQGKNNEDSRDFPMKVNSWHHAVNSNLANCLISSALATDDVIEAVEEKYPGNLNCFGIQFHPEYLQKEMTPTEFHQQNRILHAFKTSSTQFHFSRQVKQDIKRNKVNNLFFQKSSNQIKPTHQSLLKIKEMENDPIAKSMTLK
ncbi:MAG: gamma-glutamyl-gamma-aminobutyrate hydrolase family protein [Gammaproteobacteria bacterium]|nr:gamma-glutamyl-gamma-aminobutyrate hydrolase family protein [Gammaproteobacteria bacterium]